MLIKERKVSLLFLFIIVILTINITANTFDYEKARLYDSLKSPSDANMTIDISYTKKTITKPEAVNVKKQKAEEISKELSENSNRTIRPGSLGLSQQDGSEIQLSETRKRISRLKLRNDTTIFANKEKTKTNYEGTTINTGFGEDDPTYFIDHKLKTASIWKNKRFLGYDVLIFGKVDKAVLLDIVVLCNPKSLQDANTPKKKDFLYSGSGVIDGKTTDEIECVNLETGQTEYKIYLDPNDWSMCRKYIKYDEESGSVSKIVEYKEFSKAEGNGELFPRLILTRHFDKDGQETKIETINVSKVVVGQPIPEDIFNLDVPNDYTIRDMRVSPPETIQPR